MADTTAGYRRAEGHSLDPELEGILDELVRDWMAGTPRPLRAYLDRRPGLGGRSDVAVELINQEVILRQLRGEAPRPSDYAAEFPELAESVERLFEVHGLATDALESTDDTMEQSPIARASATGPPGARLPEVPGYEVESFLGRGGMGVVYLARHQGLNRKVALKRLQESRQEDPGHVARFRREAAAAARCQHPNLVQIHDIGEHAGELYLALEYVAGGHLGRALAGEPQPPRKAAELVETLARAIDHAHAQGVIHRDLKPANVLLTPDGQPKITDFGLAKLRGSTTDTEVGTVVGTLAYMAPEQVQARSGDIGPRTDIHALGAILYEALTGRPPYRAETPERILHAILSEEVMPPSARQPGVPRDLEAICLKCLEKEPARRYETAADLAEDLRRFLNGRPTAARPASPAERLVRWCRRNRWAAAAIASLLSLTMLSAWQAVRATVAERAAVDEAANALALVRFIREDLLAQASVYGQLRLGLRPNPSLMMRTALDRAAETLGDRFARQPRLEASIRRTIGESYQGLGLFPQALVNLRRAIDLCRRTLGDGHPDTLVARVALGRLYTADMKFAEAEPLLLAAMKGLEQARGTDHPDTLDAVGALAELSLLQGSLSEAEGFYESLRRTFLRTRGADDPETLAAASGLALVRAHRRDSEQARELMSSTLARLVQTLGDDHPRTLAARVELAWVQELLGNRAEAEGILEDVRAREKRILGRRHPDTLHCMALLGYLYAIDKAFDKAEPTLLEALEGCRAALDANHGATDLVLASLSIIYSIRGDLEKLRPVLMEALEITRSRWGPDSDLTEGANQAVVLFFLRRRDYAGAEPYARECVRYWQRTDAGHPNRFLNEFRLGVCLLGQKRFPEAARRLLTAYNGMAGREERIISRGEADLGWLIWRITRLGERAGQAIQDASMKRLRDDPGLLDAIYDLQFPIDPFAAK